MGRLARLTPLAAAVALARSAAPLQRSGAVTPVISPDGMVTDGVGHEPFETAQRTALGVSAAGSVHASAGGPVPLAEADALARTEELAALVPPAAPKSVPSAAEVQHGEAKVMSASRIAAEAKSSSVRLLRREPGIGEAALELGEDPVRTIDCVWNTWSMWGSCDKKCGKGLKRRERTKRTPASGPNARSCDPPETEQYEECNDGPCTKKTTTTTTSTTTMYFEEEEEATIAPIIVTTPAPADKPKEGLPKFVIGGIGIVIVGGIAAVIYMMTAGADAKQKKKKKAGKK